MPSKQPTPANFTTAPQVKSLALTTYQLNLLRTAAHYDLRQWTERRRSNADLEGLFFRVVRAFAPDLFIEAGAKDGGTSRRVRRRLDDARIVAFEANPYTYERFAASNAPPELGVEYLHLALSERPGVITFNVRKTAEGEPSADGQGSLTKRADHAEYEEVQVDCTSLDEFFADFGYESCALWVDVEGASEQVLRGGSKILSKACLVMIEVEDRPLWGQQWLASDVASHLFDAGLVPVARDFQARYLYNVLFVRESLLGNDLFCRYLSEYFSLCASTKPAPPPSTPTTKLRKLVRSPRRFVRDSRLYRRLVGAGDETTES